MTVPSHSNSQSFINDRDFIEQLKRYEDMVLHGASAYFDVETLLDIADYYGMYGRQHDVEKCISYGLRLYPEAVDLLVYEARNKILAGDLKSGHEIVDMLAPSEEYEVKLLKGELLLAEGQVTDAELLYESYVDENETDLATFYYDVASILCDYDCYTEALDWLKRSVPEVSGDQQSQRMQLEADCLIQLGETTQAEAILNALLDNDPFKPDVWTLMAESQLKTFRPLEAIESCDYALAVDEKCQEALRLKGESLLRIDSYEKALEVYSKLLNINASDSFATLMIGMCHANMENLTEGIDWLHRALDITSAKDTDIRKQIYIQLAYIEGRDKRIVTAIKDAGKAEALGQKTIENEILRAQIYLHNDRIPDGVKLLDKAFNDDEATDEDRILVVETYCRSELYTLCESYMRQFKAWYPDQENRLYAYAAQCRYGLGDRQGFLQNLKLACEQDPQGAQDMFKDMFPGLPPENYYQAALKKPDLPIN